MPLVKYEIIKSYGISGDVSLVKILGVEISPSVELLKDRNGDYHVLVTLGGGFGAGLGKEQSVAMTYTEYKVEKGTTDFSGISLGAEGDLGILFFGNDVSLMTSATSESWTLQQSYGPQITAEAMLKGAYTFDIKIGKGKNVDKFSELIIKTIKQELKLK